MAPRSGARKRKRPGTSMGTGASAAFIAFLDSEFGPFQSIISGDPDPDIQLWEHLDWDSGEMIVSPYSAPKTITGGKLPMQAKTQGGRHADLSRPRWITILAPCNCSAPSVTRVTATRRCRISRIRNSPATNAWICGAPGPLGMGRWSATRLCTECPGRYRRAGNPARQSADGYTHRTPPVRSADSLAPAVLATVSINASAYLSGGVFLHNIDQFPKKR